MTTKFLYNGIKHNGILHKCSYSQGNYVKYDSLTIAIYSRGYKNLPRIEHLNILNDSDIMTDYFEEDRAYIEPSNPLFEQVQSAYNQGRAKDLRRWIKKLEKRITINPKQIYRDDINRYTVELAQLSKQA